ncbi:MAG: DUF4097 family beta strand repeat protein, partial [Armatimonadetes bacterium]|nr:DUF4097 family beta strand repeat protein [Armatimonadota bacterium]
MKDQVLRILRMVQEGRLSPEDAFDLMDAFTNFDHDQAATPPPPPPGAKEKPKQEEPFRKFVDSIEKMTKEAIGGVDWSSVATQVRSATKKGVDTLRDSVDHLSKGNYKFPWFGPYETKTVELPLSISPGKTIRLERTSGDVKVLGGFSEPKLIATAKLRGTDKDDAHNKAEAWTPVIEENDGSVTIRQSADALEEDLELQVPSGIDLDIRIQSGDVKVRDTKGSLRLDAKSGDIEAQDLTGSVEIISYAGDVQIRQSDASLIEVENKSGDVALINTKGNIVIRSASGDVRCKEVSAAAISVESVSGDIDLDVAEPIAGALNARTVSGDILIDIASGSNCRVSLS